MVKRGRKPTEKKDYFCEEEEKAVADYINAETQEEKNYIFEKYLSPAFTKMIESIIRKYNLFPKGEEFDETFDDVMAFVITKIDKFDPNRGFKAYSYIGTMCKHYLIAKCKDTTKRINRDVNYDEVSADIIESNEYAYLMPIPGNQEMTELIENTIININDEVSNENSKFSHSEKLVGNAISMLLENWDELFTDFGSNKFNKSSILMYLKEVTGLTTKEVRSSMRRYKIMYFKTKNSLV